MSASGSAYEAQNYVELEININPKIHLSEEQTETQYVLQANVFDTATTLKCHS